MDKRISFVILHFNVIKETVDCIESIKKALEGENYQIIVVDNSSPNHSGRLLKERYKGSERIYVILNSENLGFAKGNNIGYRYAVEKLSSDFICILNNDTLVEQKNFFDIIKKEYEKSCFGIMGPQIILKNGQINPVYYLFPDLKFFEEELRIHKRDYWQMKWFLNYPIVAFKLLRNKLYQLAGKKTVSRHAKYQLTTDLDKRRENVILHGCCIVFSPQYIGKYTDAFNSKTFLYKEEELLFLRCQEKNLKVVYNPELKIKHLEDAATNSIKRGRRKRIMFWLQNQIASLEILINVIRKGE
ncbi:MAG: glycosyltransferase family 2 protein [Dorea sp.]|jgi:GT2 family glycosyltransferase|nr:glycosyltransferase family 2 protein [Dorea sp.]